jgi:hypothetical protein
LNKATNEETKTTRTLLNERKDEASAQRTKNVTSAFQRCEIVTAKGLDVVQPMLELRQTEEQAGRALAIVSAAHPVRSNTNHPKDSELFEQQQQPKTCW